MTIQDAIREQTREIVDAISLIDARSKSLHAQRAAAEDRLKRASTEITRSRTLESERKRLVGEAEERLQEVQDKLDEIDRQRQELLERLLEKRTEKEQAESLLKEARRQTEKSLVVVREETQSRDDTARLLNEIAAEKTHHDSRLFTAYRRSLDFYMNELGKRIEQTFVGEEERSRRARATAAFRKARHESPQISDLCDQRDQFTELIRLATVPAVKSTLGHELHKVEQELERRYPGALSVQESVRSTVPIEELYYLTPSDSGVCVILPISEQVWTGIERGDTGLAATRAMRIIWGMVSSLGLTASDGEFCLENGFCMFLTKGLNVDAMSTLEGFTLNMKESETLTFRFSPLPAEIQEALLHEETHA